MQFLGDEHLSFMKIVSSQVFKTPLVTLQDLLVSSIHTNSILDLILFSYVSLLLYGNSTHT